MYENQSRLSSNAFFEGTRLRDGDATRRFDLRWARFGEARRFDLRWERFGEERRFDLRWARFGEARRVLSDFLAIYLIYFFIFLHLWKFDWIDKYI
jgi:hypothetical protein